jgi:hypothetical protein
MSVQTWEQCQTTMQAAATLFNTFTTAKTIINPQAQVLLPAQFFYIGKMLRITVVGAISNIVTTPGTITFQVQVGPAVPATIVAFTTGAIQLNATAHTTLPFWLEILLTCRTVGDVAVATLMGQAWIAGIMVTRTAGQTDDAQGMQVQLAPATAPAVGTGFNSTVPNVLDMFGAFSISNAGNGVQVQQYVVEDMN